MDTRIPEQTVRDDTGRTRVLVVEDDRAMLDLLRDFLTREGYQVAATPSGEDAVQRMSDRCVDVVLADLKLEGIDGMSVLRAVKEQRPETPVILFTAFGSIESAVEAVKEGAFHYLTKPFKLKELKLTIERALEHTRLREENVRLRKEVEGRYRFDSLIGKSPKMREVFELIALVSQSSSHVLITGASGTGKELVAKAIHYNSRRRDRPFIPVNCAAIPSELLESELFGYMKGAFTGAHVSRRGLIESAQGGTLFLDEIADLAAPLQAKLLRVIQDKEVWPVGGREGVKIDTRVIAATNRDLWNLVEARAFREDLYFRLAVIRIHLPPLAERLEDIPLLVDHFLKKYGALSGKAVTGISEATLARLLRHPWRGNVRELENVIEAAVALAKGPLVTLDDLNPMLPTDTGALRGSTWCTLEELERAHIAQALRNTGGNVTKAAELLGISRKTLHRKKRLYRLDAVPE
jgi:DNA-binding NtrC family response regulator